MKKLLLISMIILVAIGLLIVGFRWGYGNNADPEKDPNEDIVPIQFESKQEINLFFTNKDHSKILSEPREVVIENAEQLSRVAIEELIKGPVSTEMKKAIPEGTRLLDIKQEGTVATVNFSREYYNTDEKTRELIARFSVVNTLCELPNIQKVKIMVEDREILKPDGQPVGVLGKEDVAFEAQPGEKTDTTIALYFAGKGDNAGYLVREKRQIAAKEGEVEKYIMQELISGPGNENSSRTIPAETKILSIETAREGICTVSLSQDFKTKHSGGSAGEVLTIYSVVNSLTELPHIDKVQFLIEGQKVEVFKHMIFNEPFVRDDEIIKNNEE